MAKLALQYHATEKPSPQPQRTKFIARDRSYHGSTLQTLSLSGFKSRRKIFERVLSKYTSFVSACNAYRGMKDGMTTAQYVKALAQELEDKIVKEGEDEVAAFICEPVVGAVRQCSFVDMYYLG
jgi:adenosylmethionine-8-amino-7-oxononanoate aminotransferase